MEILCFFSGMVFFYTFSVYACLLLAVACILYPRWTLPSSFLAALLWGFLHQWWSSGSFIAMEETVPKANITGTIVSIPQTKSTHAQFYFLITRLNNQPIHTLALLSCYQHCPLFKAGDHWAFQAKLKKPVNLGNPGSFDYKRWLNAQHVHWTGYLRPYNMKRLKQAPKQTLLLFREQLAGTLANLIPEKAILGIVKALTLGLTQDLDKAHWDLFRRTGTTHLMVISGAHIGLIAGLSFYLTQWLWTRSSRLALYLAAPKIASIVSVIIALTYALLAGFAAPTQRAFTVCSFLLLKYFSSYHVTMWQAWRYSLLAVLLFEPHVVLLPGFYLSFIAVASLLLGSQRLSYKKLKKTFCLQIICLLSLLPLTLYWFSYGALNGIIANLIAIPWVSFILVPGALVSLIIIQIWNDPLILIPIKLATETLLGYLHFIDKFSFLNLSFSFTHFLPVIALMLALLLILFFPIKTVLPGIIILITSSLFPGYPHVHEGNAEIHVMDVSQGLAVVVRTSHHLLVYDTGVKFYKGNDMANLAIIPFLKTIGAKKIDKVVISHPDLDHRGGLASLEKEYNIKELIVNDIDFYHRGKDCHHYPAWKWDGVLFRFFAIHKQFKNKNNNSCVLGIENQEGQKILLTGDIEKLAENYLVDYYGQQLRSQVLIVPHHGSKTSSSPEFIHQVTPRYAIISAGLNNQYHFPHLATLRTLSKQQITVFNTASCGMVTLLLNHANKPFCYFPKKLEFSHFRPSI